MRHEAGTSNEVPFVKYLLHDVTTAFADLHLTLRQKRCKNGQKSWLPNNLGDWAIKYIDKNRIINDNEDKQAHLEV